MNNTNLMNHKPIPFFTKKETNHISYILEEKKIYNYIMQHSTSSEFIVIHLIGPSQIGKSTLLQILSGVEHKIGNKLRSQTKGATIVYGGKIEDIYKRMGLKIPKDNFRNVDVFFCDTEGIYDETEKGSIASLLIPLLIISTKNVVLSTVSPSSSLSNFLSICKSFINISDDYNTEDPFKNKLIVRFKDFPDEVGENSNKIIEENLKLLEKESEVVEHFHKESIYPIFVPGGPWNYEKKCHYEHFNKYFLDKLFAPQENMRIYSNPKKFIDDANFICKIGKTNNSRILMLFKEKNVAERVLDFFCIELENDINNFFNDLMLKMRYFDEEIDLYFQKNVLVKLTNVVERNSISSDYFDKYLKMEEKYFSKKEKELKKAVSRYEKYINAIEEAQNNKTRICEELKYLSESIADNGISAAETIFYNTRNHLTKIDEYEDKIKSAINLKKPLSIQQLRDSHIPITEITEFIRSDIDQIFDILMKFRDFAFYRQHGLISRILSFLFDKEEIKIQAEEIEPNSNVWGYVNKFNGKYSFIIVEPRNYLPKFIDKIKEMIDDEITESFEDDQKNLFNEYIKKYKMEYIADLSQEHIKKLTIDQVKSLINE